MSLHIDRLRDPVSAPAPWFAFLLLLGSVAVAEPASAQYMPGGGGDGVMATGVGQVSLEPSRLELTMRVQAQGIDAKSAAQSLMDHKEKVREDLVAMNADPESITFTSTKFESGQSEQQRQAAQMMQYQMRASGVPASVPDDTPEIVTAIAGLTAQWALPDVDRDALALLPQRLKEQVVSRDLAGKKNQPDLDDEARESLEQMQEMMEESFGGFGFGDGDDSSGPRIVFTATAEPEQREEAMQQAFKKARDSAELIASAAGIGLGKLRRIAAQDQQTESFQMARFSGYGEDELVMPETEGQLTAATLDGLSLKISVMTVYEIEP